jgi:hypothetical protein
MKGVFAVVALSLVAVVLAATGDAHSDNFGADFVSGSGAMKAREVQNVAVEQAGANVIPAQVVAHLPSHSEAESESAGEMEGEGVDVHMEEEEEGEGAEEAELALTELNGESETEAEAEAAAAAAPPAPPATAARGPVVAVRSTASTTAAPKAQAPIVKAVQKGAAPAPKVVAAPQPPANPLVQKKPSTAVPAMAGPAIPDVSAKELRKAQLARQKALRRNRRLRRKLRRIRRAMRRVIAREREKCAGKCDRDFPVYVGPAHTLNTKTRRVIVQGDRERNRKRWQAVATHKRLLWHPPSLRKVYRHYNKASNRIAKQHKKIKRISNAPLVERK